MAFIACWNLRWIKLHFQFVWHIWFWSNCSWCMLCRSPIIWPDEGSRRCFHQKRGIMQLLKLHCTKLLSKSIWFGICLLEPKPDHRHNLRQKVDLLALWSAIPLLPSCTNPSLSSHKNTALYPRICSQKLSVSFRCKLDPWNQDVSLDRNSFLSVSNDHEKVVGTYIWCVYWNLSWRWTQYYSSAHAQRWTANDSPPPAIFLSDESCRPVR